MLAQRFSDSAVVWLDHRMLRIGREMGRDDAHDGPTSPSAPTALLAPRVVHAIRVMLKMDSWISHKNFRWHVLDKPFQRLIRQRPFHENGFVAAQVGAERAVQTQDGSRRESALPKRVSILEAVVIKFRAADILPMDVQCAPIESGPWRGKMGTGRKRR